MVKDKWQIIVRTFCERDHLLVEALYSIAMQPWADKEVIVAYHIPNEAKHQTTAAMVAKFHSYFPIKEVALGKEGTNRSQLMNKALEVVDGEFLSFLDDDDVYYPAFSRLVTDLSTDESCDFLFGNSITAHVSPYPGWNYVQRKEQGSGEKFSYLKLLMDNYIPINTYLVRTAAIGDIRFDPKLDLLEDWAFLLDIASRKGFDARYVDQAVSEYRKPLDHSNTGFNPETAAAWQQSRAYVRETRGASRSHQISGEEISLFADHYDQLAGRANSMTVWESSVLYRVGDKLRSSSVIRPILKLFSSLSRSTYQAIKRLTRR